MNNTVTLDLNRYHDLIAKEIALEEKGKSLVRIQEFHDSYRVEVWNTTDVIDKLVKSNKFFEDRSVDLNDAFHKEFEKRCQLEKELNELKELKEKTETKIAPPEKVDTNPFQKYLFSDVDLKRSKFSELVIGLLALSGLSVLLYYVFQLFTLLFTL